jgi:4'-phosphopantetheinyl transferase
MTRRATTRVRLLRLEADAADAPPAWLNDGERERLERMTAPLRRRQFIAGHRLARELAAATTGSGFATWDLVADEYGAPRLLAGGVASPWHVSLAHGGEWIACALATVPIGIDLESAPRPRDVAALARHALAPRNADEVVALADEARTAAFYRYWALAEAQGKHGGRGFHAHVARANTFVEVEAATASGGTWQADTMTLAVWLPGGDPRGIVIEGWDAPTPRFWTTA